MTNTPPVQINTADIPQAAGQLVTLVDRFLPTPVRVGIYTTAGIVAAASVALAPVLGGTAESILRLVGEVAGVVSAAIAVSHVTK